MNISSQWNSIFCIKNDNIGKQVKQQQNNTYSNIQLM